MKKGKYEYLRSVINNNADILDSVAKHGRQTRSKMYGWVAIGMLFGYFVETQISNLDTRLSKLERRTDDLSDVVDAEVKEVEDFEEE